MASSDSHAPRSSGSMKNCREDFPAQRCRVLSAMQHYSATCEAVTTRAPARGAGILQKSQRTARLTIVLRLSSESWLQAPLSPEVICYSRLGITSNCSQNDCCFLLSGPLALFSDAGRKSLFKGFRSTQGV
jgi:hypothetical protein